MKEDTFSLKHHIFLPFARMEVPKSYKVKSYKVIFCACWSVVSSIFTNLC